MAMEKGLRPIYARRYDWQRTWNTPTHARAFCRLWVSFTVWRDVGVRS
jgi:hypothetical protein